MVEWKPVVGFESRYEVSSDGRVRSKDMVVGAKGGKTAVRKGRQLAQSIKRPSPYRQVTLTARDGTRVSALVHCVVAEAFIGPRPEGLQVAHDDGDPSNNSAENLRYCTAKENYLDSVFHGKRPRGSRHPTAKIDDDTALKIKTETGRRKDIAARFGVTLSLVNQIKSGRTWRHI